MTVKPEDLLNPEAKKAFDEAMTERKATVVRKAVVNALDDNRDKAGEIDVRKALKELEPKKSTRYSLTNRIVAFLISLLVFELLINGFAIWLINEYLLPINAEEYGALGLILAASITSGTTLPIAFYRYILRDLL